MQDTKHNLLLHRTSQYVVLVLILTGLSAVAYHYFGVRASTQNTSTNALNKNGLVGAWSFDGKDTVWSSPTAGTVTDFSGNGNTGTLTNMTRATSPAMGKIGQALNFNNSNSYVNLGTSTSLNLYNSNYTVHAWIKLNAHTTDYTDEIFARGTGGCGFDVGISGSASGYGYKLFSHHFNASAPESNHANTEVSLNQWHQVAVAYDNTSHIASFYLDGVIDGEQTIGAMLDCGAQTAYIGIDGRDVVGFVPDGAEDDIRIYNRALSASEVADLYRMGGANVNTSAVQPQGLGNLNSGLAGYWPLDNGSGTSATDSSVNANTGTLTNGPTWTTGQIGGGVDFDGTDDFVTVADPASGNLDFILPSTSIDQFTITGWFNRDTFTNDHTIVAKKNDQSTGLGYIIWISGADDLLHVQVYGDGGESRINSSKTFTTTGWHHFAVAIGQNIQWDGYTDFPLIYIDGQADYNEGTGSGYQHYAGDLSNALPFRIGAESDGGNPFDGKLDEIRVYNRKLSPEEVAKLYQLTTPTNVDTSLKGYWPLDGGTTRWETNTSGTTLDLSGAGNTGIFTTLNSITSPTGGKLGQAIDFGGGDDAMSVGYMPAMANQSQLTISAWMKRRALNSAVDIMKDGGAGNMGIEFWTNGYVNFNMFTAGSGAGYVYLNDTEWHLVTLVFDGTLTGDSNRLKGYVDDVQQSLTFGSPGVAATTPDINAVLYIGHDGSTTPSDGKIDDVRVYNRALSATEVASLYLATGGQYANTIGETSILATPNSGYANLLIAQSTTNRRSMMLNSISIYTTNAVGNLRLGVYDATGPSGGPGAKVAETSGFVPVVGWNRASVITPVTLAPGTYWIAFLTDNGSLTFESTGSGSARWYSFTYGALPSTYSASPTSGSISYSLYASFDTDTISGGATINHSQDYLNRNGLVGLWSFDGRNTVWNSSTAGTTTDTSGNNNTGILTNMSRATTPAIGKIGQALNFSASGQLVSVTDPGTSSVLDFSNGTSITISTWFYPTLFSAGYGSILVKYGGGSPHNYQLAFPTGCTTICNVEFTYSANAGVTQHVFQTTAQPLTLNAWYHITATYTFGTAGSAKIYVNGVSYAGTWVFGNGTDAPDVDNAVVTIGGDICPSCSNPNEPAYGRLDDVRLYNRALSASEVASLYNQGR